MLRSMSFRLFVEWQAYLQLEPVGEQREDWRAAQLLALIANVHRDPKRRSMPYRPKEFLLQFGEPEGRRTDWRRQKEIWMDVLHDHATLLQQREKQRQRRRKAERTS